MTGSAPRKLGWVLAIAMALAMSATFADTAGATTESYAAPGDTAWISPADISSALVHLNGAAGGDGYFGAYGSIGEGGGNGGAVAATIDVLPGTSYGLRIGSAGATPGPGDSGGGRGGAPGGGMGGGGLVCPGPPASCSGGGMLWAFGGGGGATIFAAGDPLVRANYRLVAGGGGGAGNVETGVAGGSGGGLSGGASSGANGCTVSLGGDQTGSTGSGMPLAGGSGGGGGGGGGYYGGAGGGGTCGGGGGSGYIDPGTRNGSFPTPTSTGDGSASITYFTLTVSSTGPGRVSARGISCGNGRTDCTQSYAPGDTVTLATNPKKGGAFDGFSGGGCGGASTCRVTVSADTSVSAVFNASPDTTITKAPRGETGKRRARIEFESTVPGATFECSHNGAKFAACKSPAKVKAARGRNTFEVRAVSGGKAKGSPVMATWKYRPKER